ncbi:MAG: hemolysin family protein [bacterium]|nr:hemolysin family protein [bacterium]
MEDFLKNLFFTFLLIFANGFFVLAEFALVSSNPVKLKKLRFLLPYKQYQSMDHYLATCQVGITLASLVLGWLAEPTFATIFEKIFIGILKLESLVFISSHFFAIVLAFTIVTFLHLILGEQVPKLIGVYSPERVIIFSSLILEFFSFVFYPMTFVVRSVQNKIALFFGVNPYEHKEIKFSIDEVRDILKNVRESGQMSEILYNTVNSVLELNKYRVKDVMVHRTDVVYLNYNDRVESVIDIVVNTLHSRYPVYRDNIDNIVGILHIKDIFLAIRKKIFLVGEIVNFLNRKVLYVPENSDLFTVMNQMKNEQALMAIVVDEYGGNKGIITFDDVLGKILGTILDEFDLNKVKILRTKDGYVISTDVHIYELPDEIRNIFDNPKAMLSSILYDIMQGKKPKKDEIIKYKGYKIKLLEVKGNAVKYIKIYL